MNAHTPRPMARINVEDTLPRAEEGMIAIEITRFDSESRARDVVWRRLEDLLAPLR